ncbi:glycosyltransferase family 2 protein [Streptomyces goshikiensis]|uniref:glycosyltransferase family 2 protein n=1 Tax=Streptomyces goshikiensis TaxID=1942 RepID=UPI003720B2E2
MTRPRVGVAVLTMGDRMPELLALLASVAKQDEAAARVVVVGNGTALPGLPEGVTVVELEENLGVSGGRNVAWRRLRDFGDVDVLVDLDDDGLLIEADVFRRISDLYAAEDRLGIVSFRIADETGTTQRRHVPRLRAGDPMRRGLVTTFLGGGHALSMPMLEETGSWPDAFFWRRSRTRWSPCWRGDSHPRRYAEAPSERQPRWPAWSAGSTMTSAGKVRPSATTCSAFNWPASPILPGTVRG